MNDHTFAAMNAAQPRMKELQARAQENIAPLLKTLDALKAQEEVYTGGLYYFALKNNLEGYGRWMEKQETAQKEHHRVWNEIQKRYRELTGSSYHDPHREPEEFPTAPAVLDQQGAVSPEAIDAEIERLRFQLHSSILLHHGLVTQRGPATGKLRNSVQTPEAFVQEMNDFRNATLKRMADDSKLSALSPAEREQVVDDTFGFHRTAQGFGLAAFERGDYSVAGQAIGFVQRIGRFPTFEQMRIDNILSRQEPWARAQFDDGRDRYSQ